MSVGSPSGLHAAPDCADGLLDTVLRTARTSLSLTDAALENLRGADVGSLDGQIMVRAALSLPPVSIQVNECDALLLRSSK